MPDQQLPNDIERREPVEGPSVFQTNEDSTDQTRVTHEDEAPSENKNVHQDYQAFDVYDSLDKIKPGDEIIPVLSHTRKTVVERLENNADADRKDTPAARRWNDTAENSFTTVQSHAQFEATLERDGSEFHQALITEKGPIAFAQPKLADPTVAKVSGEKAQLRVRALLGLGGLMTIPLWHSGFHITIKTPSDSALIELRRKIMETKISLGRETHGLIFSNTSAYTTQWLVDFIIDHVYETTLKNTTDLRKKIVTPDLPILFWGLACAIWPKGFNYVRALFTAEGIAEKQLVSGKINVGKLMWVDNTAFTKAQKAHMSNRTISSVTEEMIERYKSDFPLYKGRSIDIGDNIKITLHVPSVEDYIRSGNQWITALTNIVEEVFTSDKDDAERRNTAIAEHANATVMRQYGHWVESVVVDESEQTDRGTIDSILETMSESTEVRKKFHVEVGKYIDDVTTAIIAIPEVSGKGTGLNKFPNLIPLDVISVFFTLLMQRAGQILTR
jgi:hypothetical protein